MSNRLIKYGFTAGVLSENLWSQTVLQKYGFGLAIGENFIIRYSGSLVSRPAMIASEVMAPFTAFKIAPFIFAHNTAGTFILLFEDSTVRFLQAGKYVLNDEQTATGATSSTSGLVVTCAAHGYAVDDLVQVFDGDVPAALSGQTLIITATTTNTFTAKLINRADFAFDSFTTANNFTVASVYTVATPFTGAELADLNIVQVRDIVRLTSYDQVVHTLERQTDGTWVLSETDFTVGIDAPTGLAQDAVSGSSTASVGFVVTAVNENGEESLPSEPFFFTSVVNYAATAGWVALKWDAQSDAVSYNVYRTQVINNSQVSAAFPFGYLGNTYAPRFTDNNIIPDYTKTPPQARNPFASKPIKFVEVTAVGTGYALTDTITVTDSTGTGAVLLPVINASGELIAVLIRDGGQDYTSPTLTVTTSGGSGATFNVTLGPASGTNPKVSGIHNQRQVYANTIQSPLGFWGSQIGLFENFNYSPIVAPDESYSYEIGSNTLGEIFHIVSTRVGMLMFTDLGVWRVTGSNGAITPNDVDAELQTAVGAASILPPLLIDSDIMYAETHTQTVRLLQYNDFSKNFGGLDISVLSRDFIKSPYALLYWDYEPRPYKLVWMVRSDGVLLSATISQEQEVYAWSETRTQGLVEAVVTLPEDDRSVTYVFVQRYLTGRWVRSIEYFAARELSTNFEHVGVDTAVPFGFTYPAVALQPSGDYEENTEITFTAASSLFTSADEGKVVIYGECKALITEYVSATVVNAQVLTSFKSQLIYRTQILRAIPAGAWVLAAFSTQQQLPVNWRPASVTVAADGKLFEDITPSATGVVTFPEELAAGYLGLSFECFAVTLPFVADGTIIEDSRVNVKGVGLRYVRSKGVEVGAYDPDVPEETEYFPMEDYFTSFMAEATRLRSDHDYIPVSSDWDENTLVAIKVSGAFPAEVSGIVFDIEVGDDIS